MKKKIEFHNMESSPNLEAHANQKLERLESILKQDEEPTPLSIELWLKSQKMHPHNACELHLKTPRFDLHAHDEGTDLYIVLDNTIDKMMRLYRDAKSKAKTKEKHAKTEKRNFTVEKDKYTLGD